MSAPAEHVERILCCNVLDSEMTHRDAIYRNPLFGFEESIAWPPPNYKDILCWHCCHVPPSVPVCLPNSYDRRKEVFHVFGFFCSLQCAKAYLMEHSAFGSGDRTMLLHYMAMKHFGHHGGSVLPAPPRHRLKIFGGDLDIVEFRKEHEFLTTSMSPPLIATPEVYERCVLPAADSWTSKGPGMRGASLTAPPIQPASSSASLFGSFVRQKRSASTALLPSPEGRTSDQPVPGTLSVFMKKKVKQ
jgi:MYM-type Zinc finger with FCS sequence motif